jgi:diguanylate cyclase (GGDEF)-like protein/PAS domain S-box-containing protein
MFRVLNCLADEHDWRLIVLAGVVCFAASLVAINIFRRAVVSQARTRLIWIAIAGGAIGYGIWATHFIAMLAYDPGIATGYGVALTALSLAAAMVLTFSGLGFAANDVGRWGAPIGGTVIGAGIASMHYLGMWALEVPGRVTWSVNLVVVSIALGIVLGIAALATAVRFNGRRATIVAALLLTLAIVAHHFTAMGAVQIIPDPTREPNALFLSPTSLALAIAGVALSVLGMSFVGTLADRRLALRTNKFEQIINQLSRAQEELEASQKQLHEQKVRLNTAINNMSQGLVLFDSSERLVLRNQRYIEMYGLSPDLVQPGRNFQDLILHRKNTGSFEGDIDEYRSSVLSSLAHGKTTRTFAHSPDGRSIQIVNQPLPDGGWLATHEDVTEQRRSEARIAYLAHHDALTGLANRVAMGQKIEEAASRYRRTGKPFSVLLLDLDRFKYVNDTLGHPAGDVLLQEVAIRLKTCLPETDVLGRLGGDEFAIIQAGEANQREAASAFADRIIEIIGKPFSIDRNEVNIGTSIGIALAPEHATTPNDLLKMADMALYRAKSVGRNSYCFFDPEMTEAAGARREVETELRHAIQNHQLTLDYQPIIDSRTSRICGVEALVRWRHPTKGVMSPDQFIPLAQETGLINQIGEWVLRTACVEAAKWPADVKLAINLSPVQFRKANLGEVVMSALAQSGLPPKRLELEITETTLIDSAAECLPTLRQFKNAGISIALDDFGTGYSSLSHLTMFPFDKIKIDKSFIQNMTKRTDCAAIISATLTLARSLEIETTAEGVETREQYQFLRLAGVTSLQGFLFKRPGPVSEIDFYGAYKSMDDAA